jgi:phage-related protein
MPAIHVSLFREDNGSVPFLGWLEELRDEKAVAKCVNAVELPGQLGPELRRPHADILRDGIHELRTRLWKVCYRILYFFHEKEAVISHGFAKPSAKVSPKEIDLAVDRKQRFRKDLQKHTYEEE